MSMRLTYTGVVIFLLTLLATASCSHARTSGRRLADSLNARAYALKYTDVDSSLALALRALAISSGRSGGRSGTPELSGGYADGRAYALNNMAYVAYQQMRYGEALHILSHVYGGSRNQIELLCADAMSMKVAQRIGDGRLFFDRRLQALRRIRRISDAEEELDGAQRHRFRSACGEMHIVSSTYYYYLGLDSVAMAEIRLAADVASQESDTLLWLYYNYMIGSGGLMDGDSAAVRLAEFDCLVRTFTRARACHAVYFEANALQSLASCLNDPRTLALVREQRIDAYAYIARQGQGVDTDVPLDAPHALPYALATRAERLFRSYKDLYQTACAIRTLGEILFSAGEYGHALRHFREALALVDMQKRRDTNGVVSWMASIHEKLSMAYAALDMKDESDRHRNIYLDLLDGSRQNREMDSRKEELSMELRAVNARLAALVALMALVFALAMAYSLRLRNHTRLYYRDILNVRRSPLFEQVAQKMEVLRRTLQDGTEILQDECRMLEMGIDENRRGNVERRAKVALTYAIVPYLDRILAEVRRMKEEGGAEPARVEYVAELTDEIMRINDALTGWIEMRSGQLKLHITTFPLRDVTDIIRLGAHAFRQKGVELCVEPADCTVKADKALTLFMVNTLADNARKFTARGGRVSVEAAARDGYVEVSVRDTGIGLSAEDVETLNNSKIYDSSHLGGGAGGKGFGFGIMNCKGIINKYRKQSALFDVCDFGVESSLGEGSRFWFRLPRVLCLAAVLALSGLARAGSGHAAPCDTAGDECEGYVRLYDAAYAANMEGRYAEALSCGEQALADDAILADTALLVVLHNEMAISALALHRWEDYGRHNAECVRLHRLYSQDSTLASYCRRMEKFKSDSVVFLVLLVLLSLAAAVLFYLTFLRDRLRGKALVTDMRRRQSEALEGMAEHIGRIGAAFDADGNTARTGAEADAADADLRAANADYSARLEAMKTSALGAAGGDAGCREAVRDLFDLLASYLREADGMLAGTERLAGRRDKARFEADRLYVTNQILDNALSTIKHETMYYPARARQIVETMGAGGAVDGAADELLDLVSYYRYVYMLLYEQAARLLEHGGFRAGRVDVAALLRTAARRVEQYAARHGGRPAVSLGEARGAATGDAMMLDYMMRRILAANMAASDAVGLEAEAAGGTVTVRVSFSGPAKDEEELHDLFSHMTTDTAYLVVRQVICGHDALAGFPGLRLRAEAEEGGFGIVFTLKEYGAKRKGNQR